MIDDEKEEEYKLIFLGESGVGKTALIKRYVYDEFNDKEISSTTMNCVEKQLIVNKKRIKLNIWDTIGQEKYRALSKLFLNEAHIIILVYSIIELKSFESLDYWRDLSKDVLGDNVILGVVGNKIDMILEQEVKEEQGREYAEKNNAFFAQLSAKENKANIEEYIEELIEEYMSKKSIQDFEIIDNREKGIIISNKKLEDLGEYQDGCCGSKAKTRKKKYDKYLKNHKGNIKIIFLGAERVGKTSLIKKIKGVEFDENESPTKILQNYDIDYMNKNSIMQEIIKIYDINNEEKENIIVKETVKKCQIYFLIYDLNNMKTFKEIEYWLKIIKSYKKEENKKNYIIEIIGNKKDLKNEEYNLILSNEESIEEDGINIGKNYSNKIGAIFHTTSAKEDKDIKDIVGEAIEKYIELA